MANKYTTLADLFTGIADAIRAKKNSTKVIVADTFPSEIKNLRTGFDYNNSRVTSIPDLAFYGCEDLNSVDCCNLTSIGTSAFENCKNLKSVTLYENTTNVGENAFKECNKDLIICYKGTNIPETWSTNWNPDNLPVFFGEPAEIWDISATEDDSVTAKLYEVESESYILLISGIGEMKSWENEHGLSEQVPWEDSYASKIKSVTIVDSVTSIGSLAFRHCGNLTSATIGDSVTNIGRFAFAGCSSLASVMIGDSVTSIGDAAFNSCISLVSITIPDSATSIGVGTFANCDSLASVTIGDSITSMGNSAFYLCKSLTSITIPDSVTNIGSYAFYACFSLTNIFFDGTMAQWNAITKEKDWNHNVPATYVQCSDGQVVL